MTSTYSRKAFLQLCALNAGSLSLLSALPHTASAQASAASSPSAGKPTVGSTFDMRDFVRWILQDFEPSVRLPGGAGRYPRRVGQTTPSLYGVADMADVLYTVGALHPSSVERTDWAAAFQLFQDPASGWYIEKEPKTLTPQHNTAFALSAMQLLDLTPKVPLKMGPEYSNIRTYLEALNWRTGVYPDSHKGAGVGSIYVLYAPLHSTSWFNEYFSTCDSLFDPQNGLMGRDKPPTGDSDQIGGTFHYSFLYQYFNRQMPYPEQRIDTVLRLQQPDGYWLPSNHLWLTLDAIYLMTRTLRYCPHRLEDVRASVRHTLKTLQQDVYSSEGRKATFSKEAGVHSLTAAISILAEAQQFLGIEEVATDWPLKLVLDRRPFI